MWLMGNHYINLVAYKTYDFLKKKLEIIKKENKIKQELKE